MVELIPLLMFGVICLVLLAGFPVAFSLAGTALIFAGIGVISGTLGSLLAYGGIYFIETKVFETTANFYPEIWIMGPLVGLFVVSVLCFYLINGIIKQSPKELLMR